MTVEDKVIYGAGAVAIGCLLASLLAMALMH
jgi:hypothetical protein